MGIIRDLYVAKKMASAGLKLPAPSVAALIKRLYMASMLNTGVDFTVSGTAPLTLTDAIHKAIHSLTQYGAVEQRNVPQGWTQVEYIESSGTQYIDLGYKGGEDSKVEIRFNYNSSSSETGSGRLFGSRISSSSDAFAVGTSSGVVGETGNKMFWCYDSQAFQIVDSVFAIDTWHEIVFSATEHTCDGVSYGDDYTPTTFETPSNLALFGFENNGTFGYGRVRASRCKLWDGATLLRDLLPVYDGTEYAMYDRVSDTILHNAGTGAFTGGSAVTPSPETPIDIWCNNGVLRFGKPLTLDTTRYYAYCTADLTNWTWSNDSFSIVIPVTVGKKYKPILTNTDSETVGSIFRYGFVDEVDDTWKSTERPETISVSMYDMVRTTTQDYTATELTATHPYLIIQMSAAYFGTALSNGYLSVTEMDVYASGTPETLTVSADGAETQTVTNIPDKLAVGTYKDEYEFISGLMTHRVGVKVLDGTENGWYATSSASTFRLLVNELLANGRVLSNCYTGVSASDYDVETMPNYTAKTHPTSDNLLYFRNEDYTTLASFKAYIAAQYAAGTPVIVLYPLATETTEQTTPHALHTAQGTNVVEVEANVAPVSLSCTYAQERGELVTLKDTLVHITNALGRPAKSVVAEFSPTQNLHGYSKPWAPGQGKNLARYEDRAEVEEYGMRFSIADGVFHLHGTSTAGCNFNTSTTRFSLPVGTYTFSLTGTFESTSPPYPLIQLRRWDGSPAVVEWINAGRPSCTFALTEDEGQNFYINFNVGAEDVGVDVDVKLQVEAGSSATTWEPYSNVCPITGGATGLEVYVSPTQDEDDGTTYTEDWSSEAGTVYKGYVDVVSGAMTAEMFGISSYNGETIGEPWLSSLDEYASGRTPTTGAQVVYTAPQTYQLDPQDVGLDIGENYVWSDTGEDVIVTYPADGEATPRQAMNILMAGNYRNNGTPDDVSDREALNITLGR